MRSFSPLTKNGSRLPSSHFIFLCAFLSACSVFTPRKTLYKQNSASSQLTQELGKLCLSGEGKGRVTLEGNDYQFKFESLTEPSKDKWTLALYIPGQGEEILTINFKDSLKGRIKVGGTFYRRIRQNLKDQSARLRQVKVFLRGMGEFFSMVKKPSVSSCQASIKNHLAKGDIYCTDSQGKKIYSSLDQDSYILSRSLDGYWDLKIKGGEKSSAMYQRVDFSAVTADTSKKYEELLGISLFYSECH